MVHDVILQLLRWMHFFFGIAWIGHLYYFNFVQGHAEKALSADQKKVAIPNYRGRAFWWFRWGAMMTFLSGLAYLLYQQFVATQQMFSGWFSTSQGWWITFGGLLGTIMWFNVWFIIWPNQKKVLGIVQVAADEKAAAAKRAGMASRINTMLSIPMLYFMVAQSHGGVAF